MSTTVDWSRTDRDLPLPEIDDATRREFLIGAAGLLLLPAGCGSGEENGEDRASGGTIRVEHAVGVTEVPQGAERIAAIDGWPNLHSLLALGVVPEIATTEYQKDSPVVRDRIGEVDRVVERGAPELESLAAAKPELIFGVDDSERIYNQLSAIAPTVLLDRYQTSVDEHLRTVARALDRPDAARRVISEFQDRLEEVTSSVRGGRLADRPVAVVMQHPSPEGTFRLLGPGSYSGRTMQAVGVTGLIDAPGEPEGPAGEFGRNVSTELMPEVLGPAELILVATSPILEGTTPWTDGPVRNGLPAVRDGAVVEVYADTWYFDTALTRQARLDDIERYLT